MYLYSNDCDPIYLVGQLPTSDFTLLDGHLSSQSISLNDLLGWSPTLSDFNKLNFKEVGSLAVITLLEKLISSRKQIQ